MSTLTARHAAIGAAITITAVIVAGLSGADATPKAATARGLMSARSGACAALLPDGTTLITGGQAGKTTLSSTELFSVRNGVSVAGEMAAARSEHACVTLPGGLVLVAGGNSASGGALNSAEIYDPSSGTWSAAGSMMMARASTTAAVLPSHKVLIAGGENAGVPTNSLELFDPGTRKFTALAATMLSKRSQHAAVTLKDGRVLLAGGFDGDKPLDSVEIYDPSTGYTTIAGKMSTPRAGLTSAVLLDGRVYLAGGSSNGKNELGSAEVFDPKKGTFSQVASMGAPRRGHMAIRLMENNGVLIVGGKANGNLLANAELYIPWWDKYKPLASLRTPQGTPGVTADLGAAIRAAFSETVVKAATSDPSLFPVISTDKDDYAPGQTAQITGSGWPAGATVTLNLVRDPNHASLAPKTWTVVADASGAFATTYDVVEGDLGETFTLTAYVGGTMETAQILRTVTFTDAVSITTIAPNSGPPSGGTSVTITGGGFGNNGDIFVVDFDTTRVSATKGSNGGTLVVTTPAHAAGCVTVKVTALDQKTGNVVSSDSLANGFCYIDPDKIAPTSSATILPSPNAAGWNNASATVTLTATDNAGGSGIASITFSATGAQTGGTTVNGSSTSVSVAAEGATTISFFATDKAGNIESTKTVLVKLDGTAPTGTLQINNGASFTNNPVVTLSLTCSDLLSGCATMAISTDGVNFPPPTGIAASPGITLPTGDGPKTVSVRLGDNAGNTVIKTATIGLDTATPVSTLTLPDVGPYNIAGWHNSVATCGAVNADPNSGYLCGAASDSGTGASGIKTVEVSVRQGNSSYLNGATQVFSEATETWIPVTLGTPVSGATPWSYLLSATKLTDGGYTVRVRSTDNAGNVETTALKTKTFTVDLIAPSITASASTSDGPFTSGNWTNKDVTVHYTCSDGGSGVADNNPTADQVVSSEGANQSKTGSCSDKAGNTATATFSGINVDKTKPTLNVPATITAEATSTSGAAVSYTVTANDNLNSPQLFTCSVASGATLPLGTTTVNCSATDKAGNQGSASFTINVVDTTPPSLQLPASFVVEQTSPAGATATYLAAATDLVDGTVAVSCLPSSGNTFPNGVTTVNCSAKDAHNNTRTGSFAITVADTIAPSGSILINGGDAYTKSASVTLTLSCADGGSGCSQMQFSDDGVTYKPAVTNAVTYNYTLTGTDGPKKVYVQFLDGVGNKSTYSATIGLDTAPPVSTLTFPGVGPYNLAGWKASAAVCAIAGADPNVGYLCGSAADAGTGASGVKSVEVSIQQANNGLYWDAATHNFSKATENFFATTLGTPANGVTPWSLPFDPTYLADGTYTVKVRSTDTAGNVETTAIKSATFLIDTTPPSINASATSNGASYTSGAWVNKDVTVHYTCTDGGSGVADNNPTADQVVSTEGANQSKSGSCTDKAGNTANATFSGINIDKTAPTASVLSRLPSANGFSWNNTDVTVTFKGADALSGIASCSTVVVSAEGANQTATGTCTDNAGNTSAPVSETGINIDKTKPVASVFSRQPDKNANGWNNTAVVVTFDGTDGGSGIDKCDTITVSTEGANQTATGKCTDKAGNVSDAVQKGYISIDKTVPVVAVPANITQEATSPNGASVTYSASLTDALSGIFTSGCVPPSPSTFALGTTAVNCNAVDKAGNSNSGTFNVLVKDTTPPTGTIKINSAAAFTNTAAVTLQLTCADIATGCATMQFSNDGTTFSSPVPVSATYNHTLTSGDGNKTVYVQFSDGAGNTSSSFTANIGLDTAAPVSTLTFPGVGPYNLAGWKASAAVCAIAGADPNLGYLCGSSVDNGTGPSGVKLVEVSIQQATNGQYWDAATQTFTKAAENFVATTVGTPANGATPWTLPFDPTYLADGTYTVKVRSTDTAGNVETSTIKSATFLIDKTPPSITASAMSNGASYTSGVWVNKDVTVHYTCTDGGSGVADNNPTADQVVSTEGANQSKSGSCTDKAGNTANATLSGINIDKTAPTAFVDTRTPANGFGWNKSDVTVTFKGTDSLSGIASCPFVTISAEGANQTATGTCTDNAGNTSAPVSQAGINIDKTAPVVSVSRNPLPNANGWNNTDVTATWGGTDGLSGIAACDVFTFTAELANQSHTGTCTDKAGNSAPLTVISGINIDKTLPASPTAILATPNPVAVKTTYKITATVNDSLSQIKSAEYNLDGGAWLPLTLSGGTATASPTSGTTAGVYNLCVRSTDAAGNLGPQDCTFLVVYDPNGGFVTGGGTITSPLKAYVADPTLTGKANFGFVSKYQKGATIPTGETEFNFKLANLNFHSEKYEWLVIAGARAQYKGTGTINNAGNYGFLLTAVDGSINGGGGTDKFRIKIWDVATGAIVYDNNMGMDDSGTPSTAIDGGSIVIHQ